MEVKPAQGTECPESGKDGPEQAATASTAHAFSFKAFLKVQESLSWVSRAASASRLNQCLDVQPQCLQFACHPRIAST